MRRSEGRRRRHRQRPRQREMRRYTAWLLLLCEAGGELVDGLRSAYGQRLWMYSERLRLRRLLWLLLLGGLLALCGEDFGRLP